MPQCSCVEKTPVMQMIKGKKSHIAFTNTVIGSDFPTKPYESLFMSESKVFCFQNEISPPQKSAIEPEESKLSLTNAHIMYLLV